MKTSLQKNSCVNIHQLLNITHNNGKIDVESLPFCGNDVTAGSETELQAVVVGKSENVDLPQTIQNANYFKNILKRARSGEMPDYVVHAIEDFISHNDHDVWENSWVRFPSHCLSHYAQEVFEKDLLKDKSKSDGYLRTDVHRFYTLINGKEFLRTPISYLLKLSLSDIVDAIQPSDIYKDLGKSFSGHFLNDNTSPETYSFYPISLTHHNQKGRGLARETALRFLMSQLLLQYANEKFELKKNGQTAMIYGAPLPATRQKQLNDFISDAFYRDLYMSPCLSGWDRGEDKYHYMGLCHQVLSRSQLNAVSKLKEAGIIVNNLVVMPNMSNTSLANNGTHVSIGSQKLTRLIMDSGSAFSAVEEKYFGDLVIKIVEHFLPLFVGTYTAAPYRMNFWDFHPEKALGFLPHELDFTHLRMIWRRWKKKADIKVLGKRLTPFGPEWLDRFLSKQLGLKGDYIPDFRLIDYLVSLMSTDESPALNGELENDSRLKEDLASMGIFDTHMSLYLFYRLRQFQNMGFSGFEGRHYSLFHSTMNDMTYAINLQVLITALAYKYIIDGTITHQSIPDNPSIESERRQIIFGQAIGIPTFYINKKTSNQFMKKIMAHVQKSRSSKRYKGYCRLYHHEYCHALIHIMKQDAADIIECMGYEDTISDLETRMNVPEQKTEHKLRAGILNQTGEKNAMMLEGDVFNKASEQYYRTTLKQFQINEAYDELAVMAKILNQQAQNSAPIRNNLYKTFNHQDIESFVQNKRSDVLNETTSASDSKRLIQLMLMGFHSEMNQR
jgi:hypothetical protein